jgi:hypothetical protein
MLNKHRTPNRKDYADFDASLNKLISAAELLNASRGRFATYPFLLAVYETYWRWSDGGRSKKRFMSMIARLKATQPQNSRNAFKILIRSAGYSPEAKQCSRWIRALEFAICEETQPRELIELFRCNGGVAGCARMAAKKDPRKGPPPDSWA